MGIFQLRVGWSPLVSSYLPTQQNQQHHNITHRFYLAIHSASTALRYTPPGKDLLYPYSAVELVLNHTLPATVKSNSVMFSYSTLSVSKEAIVVSEVCDTSVDPVQLTISFKEGELVNELGLVTRALYVFASMI